MKRLHHSILLILLLLVTVACTHRAESGAKSADGSSVAELREAGLQALNQANHTKAIKVGHMLLDSNRYDQKADGSMAAIYGRIILAQGELLADSMRNVYRYLHEAEKLCRAERNDSALASVYNGLGIYYRYVEGDMEKSLKTYFEGLEVAKRSQNKRLQSILMANIGVIYQDTHDPNALRYGLECYYTGKKSGDGLLHYMGAVTAASAYINNLSFASTDILR